MSGTKNVRLIGDEYTNTSNVIVIGRKKVISSGGSNYIPRINIDLIGLKNGSNSIYTVGEIFVNISTVTIIIDWNSRKLYEGADYTLSESGGIGTGYDTITLTGWAGESFLPRPNDRLQANYYILA